MYYTTLGAPYVPDQTGPDPNPWTGFDQHKNTCMIQKVTRLATSQSVCREL